MRWATICYRGDLEKSMVLFHGFHPLSKNSQIWRFDKLETLICPFVNGCWVWTLILHVALQWTGSLPSPSDAWLLQWWIWMKMKMKRSPLGFWKVFCFGFFFVKQRCIHFFFFSLLIQFAPGCPTAITPSTSNYCISAELDNHREYSHQHLFWSHSETHSHPREHLHMTQSSRFILHVSTVCVCVCVCTECVSVDHSSKQNRVGRGKEKKKKQSGPTGPPLSLEQNG